MTTGKVLLGVLAGISIGATLGVLFAPHKGTRTRKMIYDKSDAYAEDLVDQFNEFVDNMSKKYEVLKAEAMHVVENGKAKVDAVEHKVMNAVK
jgi:gas vesicle protein